MNEIINCIEARLFLLRGGFNILTGAEECRRALTAVASAVGLYVGVVSVADAAGWRQISFFTFVSCGVCLPVAF